MITDSIIVADLTSIDHDALPHTASHLNRFLLPDAIVARSDFFPQFFTGSRMICADHSSSSAFIQTPVKAFLQDCDKESQVIILADNGLFLSQEKLKNIQTMFC